MEELIEFQASGIVPSLILPHIRWVEISFINTRDMFGDKQVVLGEEYQVFIMDFVVLYGMHNISGCCDGESSAGWRTHGSPGPPGVDEVYRYVMLTQFFLE